ncbi:MFS transporter [Candidatus Kuenenbacteria bacterium]|nr:MFS transporter [Candidatus Kuenenbacteria bacterium]
MPKRVVGVYLLLNFLVSLSMAYMAGTYITFLRHHGLDYVSAIIPNIAYFVTIFIFELPTGAIADVFGRKFSFVLSCFIWVAAKVVYFFADNLLAFVAAEIIAAIGQTCASGAFEAWVVDSLRHEGYKGETVKIFSSGLKTKQAAMIVGAIVGTWVSKDNIAMPWIAGAITFFITAILAMFLMKEKYFVKKNFSFVSGCKEVGKTIQRGGECVLKNKNIRFVITSSAVLAFAVQAPNMQWQPFFQGLGVNRLFFGWLFAFIAIAAMIGSHYGPWLLQKIKSERKAISITLSLVGLFVFLTAIGAFKLFLALPAFLTHEIFRGLYQPIKSQYLNENIASEERATLNSFESLTSHVFGAAGLVVSGVLAKELSVEWCWLIFGLATILASWKINKK